MCVWRGWIAGLSIVDRLRDGRALCIVWQPCRESCSDNQLNGTYSWEINENGINGIENRIYTCKPHGIILIGVVLCIHIDRACYATLCFPSNRAWLTHLNTLRRKRQMSFETAHYCFLFTFLVHCMDAIWAFVSLHSTWRLECNSERFPSHLKPCLVALHRFLKTIINTKCRKTSQKSLQRKMHSQCSSCSEMEVFVLHVLMSVLGVNRESRRSLMILIYLF